MIIDFRDLESGTNLECDLCIVGAGAAGITMAHSLAGAGIQVLLLESGGFDYDSKIQELYDGERLGFETADPLTCRLHHFGGSTSHWAGYCAPLKEIDFEVRSWVPNSGWPIKKVDLDPYYEKAQKICEIGPYKYDAEAFVDESHSFPSFHPDKAVLRFWQFSPPTQFGYVYREALKKAKNIKVLLYANVTELETDATASRVKMVQIKTLEGTTGTVSAKYIVLASGGMENARLLLISNKIESNGLGNSADLVGRYFMQHPERAGVGHILTKNPDSLAYLFKRYDKNGVDVMAEVALSEHAQRQQQLLNTGFTLEEGEQGGTGYHTMRGIWQDLKSGVWPDAFGERLWSVISDLDSLAEGVYKRALDRPYQGKHIPALYVRAEQLPNPDSRISLSHERDQFGLPKISVNWQLSRYDKYSIRMATQKMAEEFGRLNIGRVRLASWLLQDDNDWPQPLWSGCHHMGTTRMSDDPKKGVVDKNCRMHSLENLYIAGSSVFPTAGYVTPTLTIVALALRLADHIKQQFQKL